MRRKKRIILYFIAIAIFFASCESNIVKPEPISSSEKTSSKEDSSSFATSSVNSQQESSQLSSQASSESSTQTSSQNPIIEKPSSFSSTSKFQPPVSSKPPALASNGFTWDKGGNFGGAIQINTPSSPKTNVLSDGGSMIDISNVSEGYITVSYTGSTKRLKFQVIKDGKTYNYDLNNNGYEEVFSLQMGNGEYKFRIMENVSGNSYVQLFTQTAVVTVNNPFSPFLYPSQYVDYNDTSNTVKKSFDLCVNASTDLDKVKSVYNYIITNIKYDTAKAQSVQAGYLPNVDNTLATNIGICFDYAAVLTTMLRAQNIPTKLVVGQVAPNDIMHAWNEVYIQNRGWITIGIQSDGAAWKRLDATFSASNQKEIANFIGNGSNYTALRIY